MEQVISRPVCAFLGLILVLAGLAGGIYMGPVHDRATDAAWTPYATVLTTQGGAFDANHESLDGVTFTVNGESWVAKMMLPGSWPQGTKFTSWVRWQPPTIQTHNPTRFHISSVIWPIVGLAVGWILGLALICLLSQFKRPRRQYVRRGTFPRTGVI